MIMSVGSPVGGQAQPSVSSPSQVWYDDIPGSICGPEDGPWPRSFRRLAPSEAWAQLAQAANPGRMAYGCNRWRADAVNFQPFPETKTQDRYAMQHIEVGGRTWTFTAVFDGHLGDATVAHAAYHMPIIVREFLEEMTVKHGGRVVPPPLIADMFSHAIRAFDDAIANDVLELFPGGLEAAVDMPDEEIYTILNDHATGGLNFKKARLCMYGTTALVALVDPEHENLWVANLGDCQGVMISETEHRTWHFEMLTRCHNGGSKSEVQRVVSEHPGEPECVVDGRVLGAIAPFRCIGDTPFKQPPEFTRRVLYNLLPGDHDTSPWEEFLVRNFTPPYISAMPEVTHYPLDASQKRLRKYLVLASDGFTDICGDHQRQVIERWLQCMDAQGTEGCVMDNMALQLLWQGLGGDPVSVSKVLTVDLDVPWLDDISIVVQSLRSSACFSRLVEIREEDAMQIDDVDDTTTTTLKPESEPSAPSTSPNDNLVDVSNAAGTKRKALQIPEDDAATYGASRFGHFGEYMHRKRAKLQIQNASMDTEANGEEKTDILRGISVYVNGWTKPSVQDIRRLLVQNGGIFQPYLDKKSIVTHVVTCSLTPAKVKEFKHMKVVRPEWLLDSVASGKLLPWTSYTFRPGDRLEGSQGSQIGQTTLQLQGARLPSCSKTSTPQSSKQSTSGELDAPGGAGPSKLMTPELEPPGSDWAPRPLYVTDPGSEEDAARVPEYAARRANEMAERVMANPQWRAAHTSIAPDFIEGFYKNSRLHHLSTWKAELKELVAEAQERAESGALDGLPDDSDDNAVVYGARTHDSATGDALSMRGAENLLRSPSRAKGKQKAEDVERVIMHCDFDCFFVSAGLVSRPQLKGKPVVVCHSQGTQGGASSTSEIASSSYEARAFGVKNGMSLRQARQLCPEVVTIPYEFERYKSFSLQFYTILMRHSDDLQAVSVDEALIDVSSAVARLKSASPFSADDFAVTLAQTIRTQVKEATGCEVSIGIAENIQLARLATRRAKPAGLYHLQKDDVQHFLEPLDIDDLHGFGHSMRQKAKEKLGVTNLGALMTRSKAQLCEVLGKGTGETLYKTLRGIDDRKLESDKPRKSVSCDINYGIRFENNEQAEAFIYRMAEEVARRLDSISMRGHSLSLKILKRDPSAPREAPKFMGHGLCESFSKQAVISNAHGLATRDSKDIGDHAWRLLKSFNFDPAELRGIGIHIQKLESAQNAADVGQAKLPFQVANKQPPSKDPGPSRQGEIQDSPEVVAQPPSSQLDTVTGAVPVEKHDNQVVGLPSLSQLDMDVLEALPDDIRKELEEEYQRHDHSPMVVDERRSPTPIVSSSSKVTTANSGSVNVKRITQQLAPRSGGSSLSAKKSMLFAKCDKTPASASGVRASEDELRALDIDPDVFAALPVDMQREQLIMARHAKQGGDGGGGGVGGPSSEQRRVIKDPTLSRTRDKSKSKSKSKSYHPAKPPPRACHPRPPTLKQQGKQQGEKLAFTDTEDVQRVIEAWVERFQEHVPNQKDVDFFGRFLVQSVEFSDAGMEKTVDVMRWWLVLLRRRWGPQEGEVGSESEVHRGQRTGPEVVGKTWWRAFRQIREQVEIAARKRFGGTLVLT